MKLPLPAPFNVMQSQGETDMTTPESIKSTIEAGLACEWVEVSGDGQHFQALIVSTAFETLSKVRRHQLAR